MEFAELAERSLYKVILYIHSLFIDILPFRNTVKTVDSLSNRVTFLFLSLSSTMNPYENALIQVVDHMLNERKCCVQNNLVREKLAMMLRMRKCGFT